MKGKPSILFLVLVIVVSGCGSGTMTERPPPAEQKMVMVPAQGDTRPNAPQAPDPVNPAANPTPDGAQPGDK